MLYIDQRVPGQNDMFVPVLSGVPGQMTRCPCGFGAYACEQNISRSYERILTKFDREMGHGPRDKKIRFWR